MTHVVLFVCACCALTRACFYSSFRGALLSSYSRDYSAAVAAAAAAQVDPYLGHSIGPVPGYTVGSNSTVQTAFGSRQLPDCNRYSNILTVRMAAIGYACLHFVIFRTI